MYVCTYIHKYECTNISMYVCTYVSTYEWIKYACMYVWMSGGIGRWHSRDQMGLTADLMSVTKTDECRKCMCLGSEHRSSTTVRWPCRMWNGEEVRNSKFLTPHHRGTRLQTGDDRSVSCGARHMVNERSKRPPGVSGRSWNLAGAARSGTTVATDPLPTRGSPYIVSSVITVHPRGEPARFQRGRKRG
jgi:hypothetical protein